MATATAGLLTAGARCVPSGGAVAVLTPGTGTPGDETAFTAVFAVGRAGGSITAVFAVGRSGGGIAELILGSGGRP